MPFARLNGIELYYEDTGAGRPVLLAHGFSATSRMWAAQIAAFSSRYRLVVYDARGQGRSEVPKGATQYSQPLMVEDLHQLMRHLGLKGACVGGLSMGGNVALNFALAHPDMLDGLLICDTGAGSDEPEVWAQKVRRWVGLLDSEGIEVFAEDYIRDPIMAGYAGRGQKEREVLWAAMTSNTAEGLARGLGGIVGNRPSIYSLRDRMEALRVPTTVIVGDRDHWCTKISRFMAATIPGAELVVIRDSGHMTNLEQPEQFNGAVERLLRRMETGEAGVR